MPGKVRDQSGREQFRAGGRRHARGVCGSVVGEGLDGKGVGDGCQVVGRVELGRRPGVGHASPSTVQGRCPGVIQELDGVGIEVRVGE